MGLEQRGCDPDRLRGLLETEEVGDEQAALLAHLDGCAECQRALEDMAAGGHWWDGLRRLNRGETTCPAGFAADGGGEDSDVGWDPDDSLGFLAPSDEPGSLGRIGPYEVAGVIGRGGMGIVLRAIDPALGRPVAIKVLAPQLASSATARRRFAREARAAAAIAHEHVVAIHSVNAAEGMPYLVMQYVPGRSLQERINAEGPLEVTEVVRIGRQAASGLAAAHAQGVVHRDIKPSNILLENCVERVKITDFGLARAMDDASLTQSGVLAGTPQYMAPEQTRGEPLDGRADLFSLGCVLYAACTGHSPFRAETTMAVLRRVNEHRPRPIREVNPDIPDWLAAIIERLLAKDPADRFPTASAVAELLERCLAHLQHPSKFPMPPLPRGHAPARGRRRLAIAAAAAALVLGGLGAAEAAGVTNLRAFAATVLRIPTRQGVLVVEAEDPDVKVFVDNESDEIEITGAGVHEVRLRPGPHRLRALKDGQPIRQEVVTITRDGKQVVKIGLEPPAPGAAPAPPLPLLPGGPAATGAAIAERLRRLAPRMPTAVPEPRGEVLRVIERPSDPGDPLTAVWCLALSPDGKRAASGHSGAVRIWDLGSKRELAHAPAAGMTVGSVAFSSDGKTLATAEHRQDLQQVTIRDADTGQVLRAFPVKLAGLNSVAFSPDDKTLAAAGWEPTIRFVDVATGRQVRTLAGHENQVTTVGYSPDGKLFASSSLDGTARLWDAATLKPKTVFRGHEGGIQRFAFSPDGKVLATSGFDATVRLWDVAGAKELAVLEGHEAPALAVTFSPDGKTLASAASLWGAKYQYAGKPSEIRVWDVATRRTTAVMRGHESHVFALAFLPGGQTLLSGGLDATLRLWDAATGAPAGRLDARPNMPGGPATLAVAYSPDAGVLATAGEERTIYLRDPSTRAVVRAFPGHGDVVTCLAFSADGKVLASGGRDRTVRLWDVSEGRTRAVLRGHDGHVFALAFSADGKTLASGGAEKFVRLWDAATGAARGTLEAPAAEVLALAFSPDGATLAACGGPDAWLWDPATKKVRAELKGAGGAIRAVAYLPDGKTLATAGDDGEAKLWDAATGAPLATLPRGGDPLTCLAPDPSGQTLAVAGAHPNVVLWDLRTRARQARLPVSQSGISALAFAPKGWQLTAAALDGPIKTWEIEAPEWLPAASFRESAAEVWTAEFTRDGKSLIWGGKTHDLWINAPPTAPGRVLTPGVGATWSVACSPDGKTYATGGWYDESAVIVWEVGTNRRLHVLRGHFDNIRSLAFSPDSRTLASASYDHTVRLWDVATGKGLPSPPEQALPVNAVRFLPDGKAIAFATGDWQASRKPGEVVVWELGAKRPKFVLRGHPSQVAAVAVAPDGKTLASASSDGIRLWNLAEGTPRRVLQPADTSVNALEYSPDGRYLASGHYQGNVVLWDVAGERQVAILKGHRGVVFDLAFSPDGETLASCGRDGTLRLWELPRRPTAEGAKAK